MAKEISEKLKQAQEILKTQTYQNNKAKLQRTQTEEQNRLADQQAHGTIADTVEDLGIQAGQALGLSPNTTTDYVMGAKDAAVNLFSSNEAIVEYYKNYDANRAKEEQKVNAVYSRELSQKQAAENNKLDMKEQKRLLKDAEKTVKDIKKDEKQGSKGSNETNYYNKAQSVLNAPESVMGTMADLFTLD